MLATSAVPNEQSKEGSGISASVGNTNMHEEGLVQGTKRPEGIRSSRREDASAIRCSERRGDEPLECRRGHAIRHEI